MPLKARCKTAALRELVELDEAAGALHLASHLGQNAKRNRDPTEV
jgi:hypothetical protein